MIQINPTGDGDCFKAQLDSAYDPNLLTAPVIVVLATDPGFLI